MSASDTTTAHTKPINTLWKALGPGILVACAAVGGSHLVWSTQAGAIYGWSLVGLILFANLIKFPFFLYGQRYTAATGESLLSGYYRKGPIYVYAFLLVNLLTGTINIAGVGMLSGALLSGYGITVPSVQVLSILIIAFCGLLLVFGHYRLLDSMAKWIVSILAIGTILAVALALGGDVARDPDFVAPSPWTLASFGFLIILLGWMPAPIDLSAWSSLWMFSREKQTGHFATVKESAIDFYIGYGSAVVLAVLFLALGKLVMFGTGESFSASGIGFSAQLVSLYTATIGDWSKWLILTAAFITMFSTTLTCLDGYPRSLAACCRLLGDLTVERFDQIRLLWILFSAVGAALVILFFVSNLLQLLTFAAVISFLTSPVLAFINYRVMTGDNVPKKDQPGWFLKTLSWIGLAFFLFMACGYAYITFFTG